SSPSIAPLKDALEEAERLFKEANITLQFLNAQKRPQNAKGLFLGFGMAGFFIGVIAAANASTGDGAGFFFLINFISLALAGAIYGITQASASSQMKSEFSKWLLQKSSIEGYIGSANDYAEAEFKRESNAVEGKFKKAQEGANERIKQSNG